MSNTATLKRTIFVDVIGEKKTFGFRIYDDYGHEYNDTIYNDKNDFPEDDLKFLEDVIANSDDQIREILENVYDNSLGMMIDGTWYDWDEISHKWL